MRFPKLSVVCEIMNKYHRSGMNLLFFLFMLRVFGTNVILFEE